VRAGSAALACAAFGWAQGVGVFTGAGDVGAVGQPGAARYDETSRTYTLTGGGENMWGATDAFHFVWKKASGDVSIAADIAFANREGNAHKKAVLVIRQDLSPGSMYASAALHADGLTSLQARDERDGRTREIQSNTSAPARLRLEKRGPYFSLSHANSPGGEPRMAGGALRVPIEGEFYIGIGVCAHDNARAEQARFASVSIEPITPRGGQPKLYSTLETITVSSTDRRVVRLFDSHIEAPNWTPDGKWLYYNGGGALWRIPPAGGEPEKIDTGFATRLNNDHGISFDGKWLAISDQSQEPRRSLIYVLPATGGTPRRVTEKAPSYWHGWSPDGKTLAYCAERNGNYDIYTIPFEGGEETHLTTAEGLDDGPEYSPDGAWIYFNSVRTGLMQIWRMQPDGSGQEQVTFDDYNNWFPHLSPDGKRMAWLTYEKDVTGHPANKEVMLRVMDLETRRVMVLAKLFGGQGTINVPSWSPDSRRLAFVSYQLIP
jgi:TolB protein